MNLLNSPALHDLEEIRLHGAGLWPLLEGKRIFISGGTGFFGRWLLEAFHYLAGIHGLGLSVTVLSRDPERFFQKAPHFRNHARIHFIAGDVGDFVFPEGPFDYVIHAATEASTSLQAHQPRVIVDTIVAGTRHMLDFAAQAETAKFLFVSSGAVYGRQPPELSHFPEDYTGAPNPCDPRSAYGEGKRMAELLCGIASKQHGLECLIARCFAFVGPYLPLDTQFAVGNFIGNALHGKPVIITGDGTAYRSYLYPTDLVVWLLTILLRGEPMRPYHVGSDVPVSIAELARLVAGLPQPAIPVQILGTPKTGALPERYVPQTRLAQTTMGLECTVDIKEALRRMWKFYVSAMPERSSCL